MFLWRCELLREFVAHEIIACDDTEVPIYKVILDKVKSQSTTQWKRTKNEVIKLELK